MNDTELWNEYRAEQKARRAERLPLRQQEIDALTADGFRIERKSEYHFRVNGALDLWPTHNRYHDLKRNKRGGYRSASDFVRKFFKESP